MRVIAGQYRSRILVAPDGWETRPTSDRLRETLFNIFGESISQAIFVDLFAGTGAVGIEALSRGAAHVYFAETAKPALTALRENLRSLGIGSLGIAAGCTIETRGTLPLLRKLAEMHVVADVVFLDPPYADSRGYAATLEALAASSILQEDSIVVVEHSSHAGAPTAPENLHPYRTLKQGDAQVTFYRKAIQTPLKDTEVE